MQKYSDKEMLAFSDIAYEDDISQYDKLVTNRAKYPDGKIPLSDLLSEAKINEIHETYKIDTNIIKSWKVVSSPGDKNGFYACVIETSKNEAAVAFRGSEDMLNPSASLTDWRHNLQLISKTTTGQQAEADRFLERNKNILQSYDRVGMTGHSLGGNLAEYSTIVAKEHGLENVVDQCVNLDGPGFNRDFIKKHQDDINNMEGVITHYKWSLVGEILDSKIGTVKYADTRYPDDIGISWELEQHDRKYATKFDENGNLLTTNSTKGNLASIVRDITTKLDNMPDWYRTITYYAVGIPTIVLLTKVGIIKKGFEFVADGVGNTINWFGDRINDLKNGLSSFFSSLFGGGNSEESETKEQTAARLAANEAAEYISFTINPVSFLNLSESADAISLNVMFVGTSLDAVKKGTTSDGTSIESIKSTVLNPFGSSVVRQYNVKIKETYEKIKTLQEAASQCRSLIDPIQETIGGCIDYLYLTGNEFIEVENDAKSRIASWY